MELYVVEQRSTGNELRVKPGFRHVVQSKRIHMFRTIQKEKLQCAERAGRID